MKKPICKCDKFFTARGKHDNGCKLARLDMQLNEFGAWCLLKSPARSTNEVAKLVNEYINHLKDK